MKTELRLVHDLANNYQALIGYAQLGDEARMIEAARKGKRLLRELETELRPLSKLKRGFWWRRDCKPGF